jgi:general secretion pathway protein J
MMRRNKGGFTLIEILISLVLLIIILGAIYNSFFTVNRAFKRFDDVSLKYHEARMSLEIMRREVEGALFRNTEQDKERTRFVIKDRDIFGTTISELKFTTFSPRNNLPVTITYFIDKKDDRLSLIKKISPLIFFQQRQFLQAKTDHEGNNGFSIETIDDIGGFTVETLYNDKWVKTWDTALTGKLPEIIRITIEFNESGRKVKLTEYARPMTGRRL